LLIYSLTPFRLREILSAAKDGVLMGFSTSHVFITIPLLTDGVASLFREPRTEEKAKAYSGILIPLTYTIPSLGVFIVLLFVLFTAWFYGNPLEIKEQIYLALVGVPSLFGSPKLSLQFILEQMRLPADAMQLYLISNPFHVYFASALTCMSMFSLSAICTAFLTGIGTLRVKRALLSIVITVIVLSATVAGLNAGFTSLLGDTSQEDETILNLKMPPDVMGGSVNQTLETTIYKTYAEVPLVPDTSNGSLVPQIRSRDVLRVGYDPDTMPLAYFNKDGELVGYDIHMAYELARTLNVSRIEFIPVDQGTFLDRVNNGSCDIVMAGVVMVPDIVDEARFTSPYLDLHLAFVTRDDQKDNFEQQEEVAQRKDLTIAIAAGSEYYQTARILFPKATFITLESPEQFFNQTGADVLLTTAETGTAMTLLHPFYDVAILQPSDTYKITSVYVVSRDCDDASLMFLNYWLDMEEQYGSLDKKYQYWVLGNDTEHQTSRWSVIRDVLHWVE
jgi:ABC-type amino acid transport substrate-binding protein